MKKQIAVMMAAATAVTTVAPVLAHADNNLYTNQSKDSIVEVVKKRLAEKYENGADGLGGTGKQGYLNSRYAIFVTGLDANVPAQKVVLDDSGFTKVEKSYYKGLQSELGTSPTGWYVVNDANKLDVLLEKAFEIDANEVPKMEVKIVDKGINDKSAFEKAAAQRIVANNEGAVDGATVKLEYVIANAKKHSFLKVTKENADEFTVEVNVKDGKEFTYKVGDSVPDFETAYSKEDKTGDVIKPESAESTILKDIKSFAVKRNLSSENIMGANTDFDVKTGDVDTYEIVNVKESKYDLGVIYTKDGGYTAKGADFVNALIDAKKVNKFNHDGINYMVNAGTIEAALDKNQVKIEKLRDGSYVLRIRFMATDKNDTDVKRELQFAITAKSDEDLHNLLVDLRGTHHVVSGKFTKLAGANRYETAVEVSKEHFEDKEANSVVIVGGEAVVDGLSAAPLASAKNAPILLAHPKNGLDATTLKEIERVCGNLNRKTVYIVGGENSVSNKTVQQLKEQFGAVVVRESGEDRTQTSEQVARRLIYDGHIDKGNGDVFLVGYSGTADAMSVSGVAAHKKVKEETPTATNEKAKVSPIIVIDKNRMGKEARVIVKQGLKARRAFVIGGVNSVGTQAYLDAQLALGSTVDDNNKMVFRIAGDNRYATNLEVINTFYSKDGGVKNVKIYSEKELKDLETAANEAKEKSNKAGNTDGKLSEADQNLKDGYEKAKAKCEELNKDEANKGLGEEYDNVLGYLKTNDDNAQQLLEDLKNALTGYYGEPNDVNKKAVDLAKAKLQKSIDDGKAFDDTTADTDDKKALAKKAVIVAELNVADKFVKDNKDKYDGLKDKITAAKAYEVAQKAYDDAKQDSDNNNESNKKVAINTIKAQGAIFVSGDNKYLVDAQTSGAFSADMEAPVVLTDKKLSLGQEKLGLYDGVLSGVRTGIYQVGGVVSSDVMKQVVELLKL